MTIGASPGKMFAAAPGKSWLTVTPERMLKTTKYAVEFVSLRYALDSVLSSVTMSKVDDLDQEARKKMIQEVLARQGMTQQDLAILLGRSIRTVQSWISGASIPELTFEETLEVSNALGEPVEKLAEMFPGKSKRRAGIKRYYQNKRDDNAK